ncbi:MAG: hypothetical protein HUU32_15885 [Calditrichaceae bacterium]|nr:hypothetical protein [Calditrichia bacterium]NUQ42868.1 hypothetical protein [Calditrichaceae bacterium]
MKLSASLFTFSLLSLIVLFSCSKDSSGPDNTVTVSGKVTLEGQSDHSGVTVSLYALVTLNPEIVAINQQYPAIGVKISQETEFDHRAGTAVYSTITNASGDWNIEKVEQGTYHVVAEKDGFGWRYALNLTAGNMGTLLLKGVKTFSGMLANQAFAFNNDFIRIDGNTIFDQNTQVSFTGVNYLVFSGNNLALILRGGVNYQADSRLFAFTANNNSNCKLNFENISNLQIQNFTALNKLAVTITNSSFNINNSVFYNPDNIAIRTSHGSGTIRNSIFRNSLVGVAMDQVNNTTVERNIYHRNQSDIEADIVDSLMIQLNSFSNAVVNLDLVSTSCEIKNNEFSNSTEGILISGLSNIKATLNDFKDYFKNVRLIAISHQPNSIALTMNHNNFINTSDFILQVATGSVSQSVDATLNYWGTTIILEIEAKIADVSNVVQFEPYLFNADPQAGINP